MPEQETIETSQSPAAIAKEKGFLGEAAENIGKDAKMASEKAAELTDIVVDSRTMRKTWQAN